MRQFLALFAIVALFTLPVFAQTEAPAPQSDLSLYHLSMDGAAPRYIPWYVWCGEDLVVDTRYNFDAQWAFSFFVGKAFGEGLFVAIPEIGMIYGPTYKAGSAELFLVGANETYTHVAITQYAAHIGDGADFFYHWYEGTFFFAEKSLQIGASEQVFREFADGAVMQIDIGPVVKTNFGQMYIKLWPTWSPTQTDVYKCYLGVGYVF